MPVLKERPQQPWVLPPGLTIGIVVGLVVGLVSLLEQVGTTPPDLAAVTAAATWLIFVSALPARNLWFVVACPAMVVLGVVGIVSGDYSWALLAGATALAMAGLRRQRRCQVATAVLATLWVATATVADTDMRLVLWGFVVPLFLLAAAVGETHGRTAAAASAAKAAAASREEEIERVLAAERKAVARELHDGVSRTLARIHLSASMLEIVDTPEERRSVQEAIQDLSEEGMAVLAEYVALLNSGRVPPGLRLSGVDPAEELGRLATELGQLGHTVKMDLALGPMEPDVAGCLVALAREATANIAKHAAGAASCSFSGRADAQGLDVAITNSLPQGSRGEPSSGVGLRLVEENFRQVGGRVRARPQDGGWRVDAHIPPRPVRVAHGERPPVGS